MYACDKDLREVGRMATSLSTYGRRRRLRYANQIKPISSTFRKELNRRRSMNTFKLFSGLGSPPALPSSNHHSTAIAASSSTARRKSVNSDEFSKTTGFMESRISRAYSSSASSNSNDSEQETAVDIAIMHQGNKRNSMNVRRKSLTESIASMYRVRESGYCKTYDILTM